MTLATFQPLSDYSCFLCFESEVQMVIFALALQIDCRSLFQTAQFIQNYRQKSLDSLNKSYFAAKYNRFDDLVLSNYSFQYLLSWRQHSQILSISFPIISLIYVILLATYVKCYQIPIQFKLFCQTQVKSEGDCQYKSSNASFNEESYNQQHPSVNVQRFISKQPGCLVEVPLIKSNTSFVIYVIYSNASMIQGLTISIIFQYRVFAGFGSLQLLWSPSQL
ncbi:Hypothetical_protein [Hexamita inflata]|uniref:Hypothetical_protein n=1 Tax=Hexamita inflata TaxID=28002 RepID=A0ABP1HH93_9EUKA